MPDECNPPVVILPGLGNSDPGHWQTLWQDAHPSWQRTAPNSWDHPELDDWLAALANLVDAAPTPPILVGHSLGTLTAIAWTAAHPETVAGLFLVAIPDPAAPSFPRVAPTFRTPPFDKVRIPVRVTYSGNDPYCESSRAKTFVQALNATSQDLGDAGHINTAAGYGPWPEGLADLQRFVGRVL